MKKIKAFCLIALISVLLYIVLSPLRAIDIRLSTAIQSIIYLLFTYFALKKGKKKGYSATLVAIAIFFGVALIDFPIRIPDWELVLISVLPTACSLIGIIIAYLYYQYRLKSVLAIFALIWLYCISYGQRQIMNYINYGHTSPHVHLSTGIGDAIVYQSVDDSVRLNDLEHKYIVLDFWNSGCGHCYKKFPMFQQLYDKYKLRKDVFIGSVFVKYKKNETFNTGDSILAKKNYTFPTLATESKSAFFQESGVRVFPTILILNERRDIIYKGDLDRACDELEEMLHD